MVEPGEHHGVGCVLVGVIGHIPLQRTQPRVHRRQVIQPAGGKKLAVLPKPAPRLRIGGQQVVTDHGGGVNVAALIDRVPPQVCEHIVLTRVNTPNRVQVELFIKNQFVPFMVQVRGQLRDARQRRRAHVPVTQGAALVHRQPPRQT